MASTIPRAALRTGAQIPLLAYGVGTAWGQSRSAPLNQALVDSIKTAINHGYHHLDCAETYGTEKEVAIAVKESGVSREKLFITHKIFKTLDTPHQTLSTALKTMEIPYVDLYLIHAPFFTSPSLQEVWTSFESLLSDGLTKAIGVSNFSIPDLKSLLSFAKTLPAVNQIEFNPYCVDWDLLQFCKENDIQVTAYSPLAPLTKFPGGPLDAVVKKIAESKGKSEAQVLLKWVLQNGVVPITTSSKEERLKNYKDLWGWELSEEEMESIKESGGKEKHRIYWKDKYAERGL